MKKVFVTSFLLLMIFAKIDLLSVSIDSTAIDTTEIKYYPNYGFTPYKIDSTIDYYPNYGFTPNKIDSTEHDNYFYSQFGFSISNVHYSELLGKALNMNGFQQKNNDLMFYGFSYETNFTTKIDKSISDFVKIFDSGTYIRLIYEFSDDALKAQNTQKLYYESASLFAFECGTTFSFLKNFTIFVGGGLGYLSYTCEFRERNYFDEVSFNDILNNKLGETSLSNWELVFPGRIGISAEIFGSGSTPDSKALRLGFNWRTISSFHENVHDWKIVGTDMTYSSLPSTLEVIDIFEFTLGLTI